MTSELRTRTISAVVLGSAVLCITWWSATAFAVMCILGAGILFREWRGLTKHRGWWWVPMGLVYIGAAMVSLIYLRHTNTAILLSTVLIVWTGDVAAYFVGRQWGQHKIAPSISPGKSWEGLAGSIVASALVAALLGHVAPLPHALLGAMLAIIGLGGDLFESTLKRHAGVKDSGTLIPGHGGLFDRVDALLPCSMVSAIALFARLH